MKKLVFLCGFMGCGKTTTGRIVADRLRLPFVDLDEYIEKSQGSKVAAIFADKGEAAFRQLESLAIKEVCANFDNAVVALGGGAIVSASNAAVINANGISIFIDVDFESCYRHIKGDESRPLAKSREALEALYNERKPIYLKHSTHTVKTIEEMLQIYDNL